VLILTIRTDKPEAEIGLFNNTKKLTYKTWPAHRQLAETLLQEINHLLSSQDCTLMQGAILRTSKTPKTSSQGQSLQRTRVNGIVCYKGPGSFTGLRIGLTVGNTLAYGWGIPVVGGTGEDWIKQGITRLLKDDNETAAMPEYGQPVHITKQKR